MRNFLYLVTATVVAGLLLLSVEYSAFKSEEELAQEVEPARELGSRDQASQTIPPRAEAQVGDFPVRSKSIRELLPLARRIHGASERNSALVELADAALEVDLPLAIEIAQYIHGADARNKAYARIIDQAISKSAFEIAGAVASRIHGADARNSQIQKVLRARLARRQN